MTKEETLKIMDRIDINYQTNYANIDSHVIEWYKELKKFDYSDVNSKLEEHMRSNFSNTIPKLYYLTKGLKTPEQKLKLQNIRQICDICKKNIDLESFDKHYNKCMTIQYIQRNVKKYLNQNINISEYYSMSDEDLEKRYDKIAKIVMRESTNNTEVFALKKYFETKGVFYEENNQIRHI